MSGYCFYHVAFGILFIYVSVFLSNRSHLQLLFSCVLVVCPVFQSVSCQDFCIGVLYSFLKPLLVILQVASQSTSPLVFRERRVELLQKWRSKGGVFLIGYTAFRNLSLGKHIKDRHVAREICQILQVVIVTFRIDNCDFLMEMRGKILLQLLHFHVLFI